MSGFPRNDVHELKTVEPWFGLLWDGQKHCEARRHDRDFQVGDALRLREYQDDGTYTGREVRARIDSMLSPDDHEGIRRGFVILSITITGRVGLTVCECMFPSLDRFGVCFKCGCRSLRSLAVPGSSPNA